MPRQLQTPPYSNAGPNTSWPRPLQPPRDLQGVPSRDLARRSRAEYRAARFVLRRVVALRATCAGLAVLLCVAQSHLDVRQRTRHKARCAVVRIVVAGRSRHVGGCTTAAGRCEGKLGCLGGSDHRDWLSTHSAVRRAIVSGFLSYFRARVGHPTARETQPMGAGGRGRAKVALARRGEVAKARAALIVWSSGAPHGQLPAPVFFWNPSAFPPRKQNPSAPSGSVAVCQDRLAARRAPRTLPAAKKRCLDFGSWLNTSQSSVVVAKNKWAWSW